MSIGEFLQLSADWGTPRDIADAARQVLGGIDLDPCSDATFNTVVGADSYYTEADDGLSPALPWRGRVFINPPGKDSGALVKRFWGRLIAEYASGAVESAVWLAFNINQLQTLQNADAPATPLDFPICVPNRRIAFLLPTNQVDLLVPGQVSLEEKRGPGHPNFIALLPDRRTTAWQVRIFREIFSRFGAVKI